MRKRRSWITYAISAALLAAVVLACASGMRQAEASREAETLRIQADSIRRAAVCCYAIEGRYPDTLEYLKENYGVYVNETDYIVGYTVFASNLMPEVTVIER